MARLRIRDIAEQAGVSPATVSRYLNNQPGQMTEATRARIAEVIDRTGYRPRTAARNLRSERSRLLGVVLADVSNPYSSAMLESLSGRAAELGYSLMTAFSAGDARVEAAALERLLDAGVDGVIVNTCGGNDDAVRSTARRVSTVLLDRAVEGAELDVVTSNNVELMGGLVRELARAGCAKIRLLTEEADSSPVRRVRAQAFEAACGVRDAEGAIVALEAEAGRATAQIDACLVEAAGGKLGLIAVNGLVFLRMVEAIAAVGPVLPEGLRIATFDDYPWNHVLFGGVTTAAQDTDEIARRVIERLLECIEAQTTLVGASAHLEPVHVEVAGTILRRSSTR